MAFPPHPERRPVVITGASAGIGTAVAQAFVASGHPVALGARRADRLDEVAEKLRAEGGEVFTHALDVTDQGSVDAFAAATVEALGPVEILVNNAGRLDPGLVHEVGTDLMAQDLEVNILGAHRMVRAFVPDMVARRRGDVVFLSSDVAEQVRPFMSAYATSKWGLEGMVKSMRLELEGSGVRVSVVRPGPTMTEMGMDWDPASTEMVLNGWMRLGLARSSHFLRARSIADAVHHVATLRRGVHIPYLEVQPEFPPDATPDAAPDATDQEDR